MSNLTDVLHTIGDRLHWTSEADKLAYHENVAGLDDDAASGEHEATDDAKTKSSKS
jgi:hypothetical protein